MSSLGSGGVFGGGVQTRWMESGGMSLRGQTYLVDV